MIWYYAGMHKEAETDDAPQRDPLIGGKLTPSQRATVKYFLVVSLLFLLQIVVGIITAHYGVEGHGFYGIPLADYLPYVVTRTWHVQLGIFWIATAWLAAGLFVGPYICGFEPKFQKLGVDLLFGALLIVVLGSMAGQWLSVMNKLSGDAWFWFGHQGYEYVDLGRVWQRRCWSVCCCGCADLSFGDTGTTARNGQRSLISLYMFATAGIALFYIPGLFWGMRSNLAVVEYWRWWVVHLWVEGSLRCLLQWCRFYVLAARHHQGRVGCKGIDTVIGHLSVRGHYRHLPSPLFFGTPTVTLAFGSVFSAPRDRTASNGRV
jgi:nitric oxide reductase subunit B